MVDEFWCEECDFWIFGVVEVVCKLDEGCLMVFGLVGILMWCCVIEVFGVVFCWQEVIIIDWVVLEINEVCVLVYCVIVCCVGVKIYCVLCMMIWCRCEGDWCIIQYQQMLV